MGIYLTGEVLKWGTFSWKGIVSWTVPNPVICLVVLTSMGIAQILLNQFLNVVVVVVHIFTLLLFEMTSGLKLEVHCFEA